VSVVFPSALLSSVVELPVPAPNILDVAVAVGSGEAPKGDVVVDVVVWNGDIDDATGEVEPYNDVEAIGSEPYENGDVVAAPWALLLKGVVAEAVVDA
jgi:hypothetical protein